MRRIYTKAMPLKYIWYIYNTNPITFIDMFVVVYVKSIKLLWWLAPRKIYKHRLFKLIDCRSIDCRSIMRTKFSIYSFLCSKYTRCISANIYKWLKKRVCASSKHLRFLIVLFLFFFDTRNLVRVSVCTYILDERGSFWDYKQFNSIWMNRNMEHQWEACAIHASVSWNWNEWDWVRRMEMLAIEWSAWS